MTGPRRRTDRRGGESIGVERALFGQGVNVGRDGVFVAVTTQHGAHVLRGDPENVRWLKVVPYGRTYREIAPGTGTGGKQETCGQDQHVMDQSGSKHKIHLAKRGYICAKELNRISFCLWCSSFWALPAFCFAARE